MRTLEHWRQLPGPWAYCYKYRPTGDATVMTVLGLWTLYFWPCDLAQLLHQFA